jgi:hypothetical protein
VRKFLSRHGDAVFMMAMVGAFVMMGTLLLRQRYLSMQGWQTDFNSRTVTLGELTVWQERDITPPVDAPTFTTIKAAHWLDKDAWVIALELNGESRAYPLALLVNHQIVNDVMQGIPIAITYCPMCNSALVFKRRVGDQTLRFGVSGATRNSGFLMWDDLTQSWWQQFTGEAIVGEYMGTRLEVLPSNIVTWKAYSKWHPMGRVLVGDETLGKLTYSPEKIDAYASEVPTVDKPIDHRLPSKERVLATVINNDAVAYPFSLLAEWGVVNDTIGGHAVVAFWQSGQEQGNAVDEGQDVGMAVLFYRTVNGQTLSFALRAGNIVDEETGSIWTIFGEAIQGPLKNTHLEQVNGSAYYWFAWVNTYPQTRLFTAPHN